MEDDILMCEFCSEQNQALPSTRRRRIWEMANSSHCSVIGTCLTMSDLRSLARKLKIQTVPGNSPDYQLHGFFAKEAESPGKPAKMLNKLLDKRHAPSIRKTRSMSTQKALSDYWVDAVDKGEIPGPYWAILSHPKVTKELSDRLFADVHMLSHLVGASNRADIRRLRSIEEQTKAFENQINRQRNQHIERLAERDQIIGELHSKIRAFEALQTVTSQTEALKPCACETIPDLNHRISELSEEFGAQKCMLKQARNRVKELQEICRTLRNENTRIEATLAQSADNQEETDLFDLNGKSLLYVGGRQQTVHRLRTLVSDWNGKLLHHDGGIESSIDQLASVINKADAVLFPTDCVSHSAAKTVKKLCHQRMKPFVPLRTSGIASFVASLKDGQLNYYAE